MTTCRHPKKVLWDFGTFQWCSQCGAAREQQWDAAAQRMDWGPWVKPAPGGVPGPS